jgi:hypothetical protein
MREYFKNYLHKFLIFININELKTLKFIVKRIFFIQSKTTILHTNIWAINFHYNDNVNEIKYFILDSTDHRDAEKRIKELSENLLNVKANELSNYKYQLYLV